MAEIKSISEVIERLQYKADNIKAKLDPSYFTECVDFLKAAEPKKGEWEDKILETDHKAWVGRYECSECKIRINQSWYYFCPNCGADMRGESNAE